MNSPGRLDGEGDETLPGQWTFATSPDRLVVQPYEGTGALLQCVYACIFSLSGLCSYYIFLSFHSFTRHHAVRWEIQSASRGKKAGRAPTSFLSVSTASWSNHSFLPPVVLGAVLLCCQSSELDVHPSNSTFYLYRKSRFDGQLSLVLKPSFLENLCTVPSILPHRDISPSARMLSRLPLATAP